MYKTLFMVPHTITDMLLFSQVVKTFVMIKNIAIHDETKLEELNFVLLKVLIFSFEEVDLKLRAMALRLHNMLPRSSLFKIRGRILLLLSLHQLEMHTHGLLILGINCA